MNHQPGKRRLTKGSFAFAIALLVVAIPATALATHTFSDVPDDKFYTEAVAWAFENEITTGTSATTFSPDDPVTRGQNVTFAKRYHDNVAQPAIDALQDELDALEAMLTADFSISHHTSALVDDGVGVPLDIERYAPDFLVEGSGYLQLPLAVPSLVNGTPFTLESVDYCLDSTAGSVNSVEVWTDDDEAAPAAIDNTDRTTPGCYTLDVGTTGSKVIVSFNFTDDGVVNIGSVDTNWTMS